jgi:alkylhydroperoxidase/carboxymuconolactone decarboxylase family protein YurZ
VHPDPNSPGYRATEFRHPRPGLDVRSRRILVIGTMIAIGRREEFEMHAAAAVREGGFTLDDLKEIVLQQAVYLRRAAAHHALTRLAKLGPV